MLKQIYKHETTGLLMKSGYVALLDSYTVEEAIYHLRQQVSGKKNVHYVYLIDETKQLTGVLSLRELLGATNTDLLAAIMKRNLVYFPADLDQEEAAKVFRDKDLVSIPVVNDQQQLMGIIHVEDIIDVIHQEADEDIGKLTASGKEISFTTRPLRAAVKRLPWLILLLFIGLISGGIIESFEETLETVVALAFFMPMIAGMTGNTGTQSLAVVVRGLVSEKLDVKKAWKLLWREFLVGIIIGITCAIIIANVAYLWRGDMYEIIDEYVVEINEEVGQVTRYSDIEGTYSGNFSNKYKKGTTFYSIEGVSAEEAIAIEEDGKYRKAINNGKYGGK